MTGGLDLVVRGRALVDGAFRDAAVGIRDGRIAELDASGPAAETVVLADDEVLIPGLVDTHVHVNEPGRTEWEGFASATSAAAAGGVTTIVDMPLNSIPPTTTVEGLRVKRAAAEGAVRVDVGFWGGAVPESLGALRPLWDAGVFGFKCFLAPTGVAEFGHLDRRQLDAALEEVASFGGLLIVHAEDPGVLHAHENSGGTDYGRYLATRPDAAEVAAIAHVIAGVRRTGARAHIVHLSSAEAIPELRAARAEGLPITVETCPHYLSLAAEGVPDGATRYKCAPPIRSEANRDALWRALLDGDIDLVVTDHSPSTAELKLAGDGDFGVAWGGIAGLQLGLSAVWTAAAARGVALERVVEWMSAAPARLVGLAPERGAIAVGARADLAVFAPDARRVVRAGELLHRNPVSAYDGHELRGAVRRTWLAGRPVDPGRPGSPGGGARPAGRLLERNPPVSYRLEHQYGKAESRIVRIVRDTPRHEIVDLNVTTALRGDFADAYLTGDQSKVLPTDSQKNTAYSYVKEKGVPSIEEYGLELARHFVSATEPVTGARIEIEQYAWERATVGGSGHDHTFVRSGAEVRTAAVTVDQTGEYVIAGFKDLVILKSTGSEFHGFLKDRYTTLPETDDRIMATSLDVKWRYAGIDADWNAVYAAVKAIMIERFATLHSLALQQTLWHMGTAVLDVHPGIVEIRLKAPNKHHFDYDLARFGVEQRGEVFNADDRPYGLIEAVISREDAPSAHEAWHASLGAA